MKGKRLGKRYSAGIHKNKCRMKLLNYSDTDDINASTVFPFKMSGEFSETFNTHYLHNVLIIPGGDD